MSAGAPPERRRADRRRSDRRSNTRRRRARQDVEDSWFGALADAGDSAQSTNGFEGAAQEGGEDRSGTSESRFLAREARRIVSGEGTALHRVFRAYVTARAVLGAALVVAPWAMSVLGTRPPLPLVLVCLIYASQAVSLWLLGGPSDEPGTPMARLRRRQWALTIGVDLVAFSTLHLMETAQQLNYSALLALPVLMAGIMTKRVAALATASLVALVLLAGAWRPSMQEGDMVALSLRAGLAGIGAFVIALIAGELAQRLAREERAARGSLEIARQQAQLNRLVLEEMADGVVVVDRRARMRATNPAARVMLGMKLHTQPMPMPLQVNPAWRPLLEAVEQAFALGHWPDAARELRLGADAGPQRLVQVRARFTRRSGIDDTDGDQPEDVCVLFLEDMRNVQARVRQEKLAAMGRMSAGISHEIRNPLAAIAQANALMLEDAVDPAQQRLTRIVEDNVQRLKAIVDDVLAVAPTEVVRPQPVDATQQLRLICEEWLQTPDINGGGARTPLDRVDMRLPNTPMPVLFDVDHLRRVLVNLLDNARRHGTTEAGAIRVSLAVEPQGGTSLAIASDGPAMPPDVERHLFEPFFSTRSRGTGLGLYICRELCERYGATIEYRPGAPGERHCNVFRVVMRPAVMP
ncbi:MAG: histidine kinase [Ideonella sp.]|nr:histidine kinase [Ideonella sp.]MBL0149298.1 histidine kinase [Ideonella sp.]